MYSSSSENISEELEERKNKPHAEDFKSNRRSASHANNGGRKRSHKKEYKRIRNLAEARHLGPTREDFRLKSIAFNEHISAASASLSIPQESGT